MGPCFAIEPAEALADAGLGEVGDAKAGPLGGCGQRLHLESEGSWWEQRVSGVPQRCQAGGRSQALPCSGEQGFGNKRLLLSCEVSPEEKAHGVT